MLECSDMKVRGLFQLSVYDNIESIEQLNDIRNGISLQNPIMEFKKENVITLLGRKRVAELIAGSSSDFITEIAIGDGGASALDDSIPLIPTVNDVALTNEVDRQTASGAVLSGTQKAEFTAGFITANIPGGAYLGTPKINEAGLFCSDGILFARRTYPSIAFGPADRVGQLVRWIIEVL